jgi:hypothetical protein
MKQSNSEPHGNWHCFLISKRLPCVRTVPSLIKTKEVQIFSAVSNECVESNTPEPSSLACWIRERKSFAGHLWFWPKKVEKYGDEILRILNS